MVGIDVWFDKYPLRGGQRWTVEVRKATKGCRYFLALLSSKSVSKRGCVQKELTDALNLLDEFSRVGGIHRSGTLGRMRVPAVTEHLGLRSRRERFQRLAMGSMHRFVHLT